MIIRIRPLLLLSCLCLLACSGDQTRALAASLSFEPPASDPPSRRELSRAFRQGEVVVAYSAGSEALRAAAERFADPRGRIRFRAVADQALKREDLREQVVLALGSPATNWISRELNRELPFRLTTQTIQFAEQTYADPTAWLSLPLYPSPFNQQLPIAWISGCSDISIAGELNKKLDEGWSPFGWGGGGYEIYRQGERVLLGFFQEHDWRPDQRLQFDFSAARDTAFVSPHYRFLAGQTRPPAGDLQKLVEACETAARAIRDFTGVEEPVARIDLHLHSSIEEKGLRLNNTEQAHIDYERMAVHTVYNDIYRHNWIGKENELLLRQLLGQPQTTALERGLAVRFSTGWQTRGYAYWAQSLFRSGNLPPLSQILDNQRFLESSRLVFEPAAASFVDFLIADWGRETFLERYRRWQPADAEIRRLEKAWHEAIICREGDFTPPSWSKKELPYLRGFNFTHEGYAIYNGYASRLAAESLSKMASLGSNAASIIPYSFMRDPQAPAAFPIPDRPGSENDESVIHALYAAKKLGMITVLKPQVWLGGGSWPGDVAMRNDEDWQTFFARYYDWIRHYALMAEIHQVDVFVVGTEFARATLAREADWVALVRKIRKLYSGKITYAANWGDEFEKVGFWNEFDYIGLDCYYPLSRNEAASYQELEANFQEVLKKIEKVQRQYRKPLLLTEVGFRSIDAPWRQPHAEANGAAYNGEHQRMCYDIVLKNLAEKDWSQGLLFWKWPSYLERRDRENTDYSPIDKPTEGAVAKWFGKMRRAHKEE